jgi:hypothetical protein
MIVTIIAPIIRCLAACLMATLRNRTTKLATREFTRCSHAWRVLENAAAEIPQTVPKVSRLSHREKKSLNDNDICVAEGVGFEPTIRFPVYTLSKRAP